MVDSASVHFDDLASFISSLSTEIRSAVLGDGVPACHVYHEYVSIIQGVKPSFFAGDPSFHGVRGDDGMVDGVPWVDSPFVCEFSPTEGRGE